MAKEPGPWLDAMWAADATKLAFAGALGGLVRWITLRNNWKEGVGSILVGAICAMYLGPIVTPILEPVFGPISPDGTGAGFTSFVVGLGGLSISGLIIDVINSRRKPEVSDE